MKKVVFILCIFLVACNSAEVEYTDSDVYIGSYRIYDQRIAFPYTLVSSETQLMLHDQDGIQIDQGVISNLLMDMDTITMSKHKYFFSYVTPERMFAFDLMDSLRFRPFDNGAMSSKNAAVFYKAKSSKNKDKAAIRKILKSQTWHFPKFETNPNDDLIIDQEWEFLENEVNIYTYYQYQDQLLHIELKTLSYKIIDIKGVCLLSLSNENKIENPLPLIQLMDVDKNELVIKYFGERKPKNRVIKVFKLPYEKDLQNKAVRFSRCFDGYQGEYYYGDDVTYFQGNQYIVDQVSDNAPAAEGNGYLIFHFSVNCKKELGDFGLLQMDRSFKARKFNPGFVRHVFNEIRKLKEWPSTLSTEDYLHYEDVHAFLMFKIEDGKITDLCP